MESLTLISGAERGIKAGPAPTTALSGAIVLGGDYRGLGIVRSLGRRGIPVWLVTDEHSVAGYSRYVSRRFRWPSACDRERAEWLCDLSLDRRSERWAILPTGDLSTRFLDVFRDPLEDAFVLAIPEPHVLNVAEDKRQTNRLAHALGLHIPRTWLPANLGVLASLDIQFPVIIKPAVKTGFNALTHDKAWKVERPSDLLPVYSRAIDCVSADLLMIQEVVPGDGSHQFSYAGLFHNGRPVADVVARRTRQYPPEFGHHSSFVESIDNPEVEAVGQAVSRHLSHTGLMEIEFKRDPRTGTLKLLDINARVWGWHTLGTGNGVDFVHLYWLLLQGKVAEYRRVGPGQAWLRAATDVTATMPRLLRRPNQLPGYVASLMTPHDSPMLAWDDPLPAVVDLPLLIKLVAGRR